MPISKPYRRTCRQFTDGSYTEGGRSQYIRHPLYAESPEHYIRAFLIILKDFQELLDYIEPSDKNLECYSFRIHSLLLRCCVEFEANCKAILKENSYSRSGNWNIKDDYSKIEKTHFLSDYEVKIPNWTGNRYSVKPFLQWASGTPLPWYQAYNATKHDRHTEFENATFLHLVDSLCGLLVILSAQFETNDFTPGDDLLSMGGPGDGTECGIGGFFRVKFPNNIPTDQRYEFNWQFLKNDPDPFDRINYNAIT